MWLKRVSYQFRGAEYWEFFGRRGKGLQFRYPSRSPKKLEGAWTTWNVVNFGITIGAGLKKGQEINWEGEWGLNCWGKKTP